jgi:hypothetical protein
MSKRAQYTKGEIGRLRIVEDFLPAPDELVPRGGKTKSARKNW